MDIDIDFGDRNSILELIKHVPATIDDGRTVKKHNTGVYCQDIPCNPLTGAASMDYRTAEARGYFKIDFLNASVYTDVRDEDHINDLLAAEPLWELLEQREFCDMIFHLNGHHGLVAELKPSNIDQLAMFIALLRPGKRHLISTCEQQGWTAIEDEIWTKTTDYYFKRAHAYGYAHAIVMQMNLICERIIPGCA
jgi:hypothetical protein